MSAEALLLNQSTRSVLLSTWLFDQAEIVEVGNEAVGFPATNLQDYQPKVKWRTSGLSNAYFIADLGLHNAEPSPVDTFILLFANLANNTTTGNPSRWRIRMGPDNGNWTFDTNFMTAWPSSGPAPELGVVDPRSPSFYTPPGAHAFHHLPEPQVLRWLRVDFDGQVFPSSTQWEIGRFACGLALKPLLPYPAGMPTPVGSPPRLQVTWPARFTPEQFELIAYGLAFNRGNAPRVLDSWGGDRHLLDGAKTVVSVNNIAAVEPWQRHQQTVYGYIEQLDETRRTRSQLVDANLTIRGL